MNLKILRKELKTLSQKHPVSDLWTSIFFLLDEYEAELREIFYQIEHEPAHEGRPRSYRYMEGWLDGARFALEKLEKILGEKVPLGRQLGLLVAGRETSRYACNKKEMPKQTVLERLPEPASRPAVNPHRTRRVLKNESGRFKKGIGESWIHG